MSEPRHSGVQSRLSDGRIFAGHGYELPSGPGGIQSVQADIIDPEALTVTPGPKVVTQGYDRGFTEEPIPCPDGVRRVYVGGGFPGNSEVLNPQMHTEAYSEDTGLCDGATGLHLLGPTTLPGGADPTVPFGVNALNALIPGGPAPTPGPLPNPLPPLVGPVAVPFPGPGLPGQIVLGAAFLGTDPAGGAGPGFYSFATACLAPFPLSGFDIFEALVRGLAQFPDGVGAVPDPPYTLPSPPFPPATPWPALGGFRVDPANGLVHFNPARGGSRVLVSCEYWLKAPTPAAPGPMEYTTAFPCSFDRGPDGRIYLIGGTGSRSHSGAVLSTGHGQVQRLDPGTGTWSLGAPMPFAVSSEPHNAVYHPPTQRFYVFGGLLGSLLGAAFYSPSTQIYDPIGDAWAVGAPNPLVALLAPGGGYVRICRPIVLDDGDILICGGAYGGPAQFNATFPPVASRACLRYTPSTNTWRQVGDMPVGISAGWLQKLADGKVLSVSGARHGTMQADRQLVRDVLIFAPASDAWAQLNPLPPYVGGHWYRGTNVATSSGHKTAFAGGNGLNLRNNLLGQTSRAVHLYCPPR
jgi:hypothetical protein